jgi:hypothetical protein
VERQRILRPSKTAWAVGSWELLGGIRVKKQIWLSSEQVELVVDCLVLVKGELNRSTISDAHAMAAKYTVGRIDDVLALLAS